MQKNKQHPGSNICSEGTFEKRRTMTKMMLRTCFLLLLLLGISQAEKKERRFRKREPKGSSTERELKNEATTERELKGGSKRGSGDDAYYAYGDDYYDDDGGFDVRESLTITLKITNLSYQQPFGPMFVMVHNADAIPLFTLGEEASVALQILSENGDPTPLAEAYGNAEGVFFSGIYTEGAPWHGGGDIYITLPYRPLFPYLTIASMAINTNDCFVALNGVRIIPNLVITGPGYDSGSEINNEQCSSIPGPACDDDDNVRSGNGEGFVHVHRGIFGIADLEANVYDWRNPMMRVEMMNPFT